MSEATTGLTVDLAFDGERVVPGKAPAYLNWAHAARYAFMRPLVTGKSVLDAGCGAGYGTAYLAKYASSAYGIDVAVDAVAYARECYAGENVTFGVMDCCDMAFPGPSFDCVCSFEVIEHLPDPARFVAEVARVLRPGGTFVVSTPNTESNFPAGENPFHLKEFNLREFSALMAPHFASAEYYGQVCHRPIRQFLFLQSTRLYLRSALYRRLLNTVAPLYFGQLNRKARPEDRDWVERVNLGAFTFTREAAEKATYIVAVCRKAQ